MIKVTKIFLIGPMGAGKSTIGKALAKKLNREFYDTDAMIIQRTGAEISWIFDIEGEEGFRLREQRVIEEIIEKDNVVIATGGGVVLSEQNRKLLAAHGFVVYLKASIVQQLKRIVRDGKHSQRPLIQYCEDPKAQLQRLAKIREPLYNQLADLTLRTDHLTVKTIVDKIVSKLAGG